MKKALQISIAGTLFSIEDDAYAKLDGYLESVKRHFASSEDKDEIVVDIESRIGELLLESKEQVVTIATVERVIKEMGDANDFGDEEKVERCAPAAPADKKLYRDRDNGIIGGVCAGLAAFFGIDVLWVRLVAIVLAFMHGIGILVYAILWVMIPEAKTSAQKLEMKGTPVTLETLSERISEKTEHGRSIAHALAVPFRILGRLIAIAIGAGMVFGAGFALVMSLIASGFLMSGSTMIGDDLTLRTLLGSAQWIFIPAGLFAGLIPLFFVLLAGLSILAKRSIITMQIGLSFLGVWFLSLVIAGFGIATMVGNYETYLATAPVYQEVTQTMPITGPVTALDVRDGAHVTIVHGTSTEPTLVATGMSKFIDSYSAHVEDGTLIIESKPVPRRACIFCTMSRPKLTLTLPEISSITAHYGSSVRSSALPAADAIAISLDNGGSADLTMKTHKLTANVSYSGELDLEGTADSAVFTADNGGEINAENFKTTDAVASADYSASVHVNADKTLKATADNGGEIRYAGEPTVTKEESYGGTVSRK